MSKSLSFIILALLVMANTKNLISASSTGQGSNPDALFSINVAEHHLTLLIAQGSKVKRV